MLANTDASQNTDQNNHDNNSTLATVPQATMGFGRLPKEAFDAEYLRLINLDIADAQANLDELPESQRRGLTLETLKHFGCGYLPNWILTKCRAEFTCGTYIDEKTGKPKSLPPMSERIIIPTSSMKHFNAVATRRARLTMKNDFWKQHAGTMELFAAPDTFKADIIVIVEGEFDAMSIWQAMQGKVAVVAILGCANQRKTLGARLHELKGKKFIILLDADAAGKKNAEKLCSMLIQERYPAVIRYLYDYLPYNIKKAPQAVKIDANEILIHYGEETLHHMMNKILEAERELDQIAERIDKEKNAEGKEAVPTLTLFSTTQENSEYDAAPDKARRIITEALKFIPAGELTRDEWFKVACVLYRYGFELADFDTWSNDGDPRYSADTCRQQWNSIKTNDELKAEGYKVGTLINIAKKYGYIPKKIQARADSETDEEIFDKLLDTFKEQYGGDIDPAILPKLKDAKNFIETLTPQTFKPQFAVDPAIWNKITLCKFYLPSLANKFFDAMKDARSLAKKILTDIASETAALKKAGEYIPDIDKTAITRLSELAPSKIADEISSRVTNIKRRHKQFLTDLQAEKDKAARQATLNELNKNPSWTQNIISDCPVNLFLPENIYLNNREVGTQTISENGNILKRAAAKTPIVVSRILREPQKHITQYEVQIKAKHIWRKVILDGDEINDTRKILRLGKDGGAIIKDPRALVNFFAELIAANEDRLIETKCYQQPGWHGNQFIYPAPATTDDYICRRAGFNYELEFATQGNPQKWKECFLAACDQGGAKARIAFGNVFSAPLVRPLNVPNLQCQLNGKSGSGKTAFLKFAASTFGNPRELIRTFGATLKNRQAVAAAYNDLPTFLDELGTLQGGKKAADSLPQMIYEFEQGKTNQAQKRNGEARETFNFYGSRTMTGEFSILKSNDPRGTHKRVICLDCGEKFFDDKFATKLHITAENHFGHFGRLWTNYVQNHLEQIRDSYLCFTEYVFPKNLNVEPTQLKSLAVDAVAYQHFRICIGAQETFDFDAAARDIKEIISALPTPAELDDSTRALADLQSYIAGHDRFFISYVATPESEKELQQDAFECYGKKFKNGEVAFLPHALKKILETELGYQSMDALIAEFAQKGLLRRGEGKGNGCRISTRINGKTAPTYRFKAGVLLSTTDDEPEYSADFSAEV